MAARINAHGDPQGVVRRDRLCEEAQIFFRYVLK